MIRWAKPGRLTLNFTRKAVTIGLVLGILSTLIQAFIDLRSERDLIENHLVAALDTMRPQAARALVDIDYDLASDVAKGIASYPPVRMVSLRDQYGQSFSYFERAEAPSNASDDIGRLLFGEPKPYEIALYYPPDKVAVGHLRIIIDQARVGSNFLERARYSLILGFVRNFLMALVFLAFFYHMLARPILHLTQAVALIDPESERLPELPLPEAHRDNELGDLVNGINDLLGAVNAQKQRRALVEAQLQTHQRNLEAEIRMRTSDLQELNERLATERNLAEKANHEKGRFLAAASHDLRQPLQTLELQVDALVNRASEAALPMALQVQSSVDSLRNLVNSLLDVSRLESGALKPQRTLFPLQSLFEKLPTQFAGQAKAKGLNFRVRPTTYWVNSDRGLLEQCLINLVTNALKYTARGFVLVAVRRRQGRLWLEVCDSGMGIPPEFQPQIFNEFEQLNNPERDRRRGVGLGLAIVKRACELLELPLSLKSAPGKGSRFSIQLSEVSPPCFPTPVMDSQPLSHWSGKSILIVEDDPDIAEALHLLLQSRGAQCQSVIDADAAIQAFNKGPRPPDLILSDLRLPGRYDGLTLAEQLMSQQASRLPVILLTGDSFTPRVQQARAMGITVVIKPVNARQLLNLVESQLQGNLDCTTGEIAPDALNPL